MNRPDLLAGVKVLEFSSMGPVPWGVSLLVDMGAVITRVCRPGPPVDDSSDHESIAERGRTDVCLDLKTKEGHKGVSELVRTHDVLIEGMRPGVMERLDLGPMDCAALNPGLVYARVTGWGQTGPLAPCAGHDINYMALSGALHAIGPRNGGPTIPLNLVGDYGGGGAFLVIGVLAALLRTKATGQGSVVDVSMLDGIARQMGLVYERLGRGDWVDERGSNWFDGGAPWYNVYEAGCGNYLAVGAIEARFYSQFVSGLGLDEDTLPDRNDKSQWDALRRLFATRFRTRTRAQWMAVFSTLDACVSPVLSLNEAPLHPQNIARQTFMSSSDGMYGYGLAPRFFPLPTPNTPAHV